MTARGTIVGGIYANVTLAVGSLQHGHLQPYRDSTASGDGSGVRAPEKQTRHRFAAGM
jgi:hypothetical protein